MTDQHTPRAVAADRRADVVHDGPPTPGEPSRWEWHVEIPYVGPVGWPLTGSLSYLITVSAVAAFEVFPWPVAGLLGLGHIMARNRDNRVVSEIGTGLKVLG